MRDLRLAAALREFRTLTQAAVHLNLTQSALSYQLADLESRVGALLFERAGRRLIPTQLGELLCGNSQRALDHMSDIERQLREAVTGRRVTLRIATECYTTYEWLPPVLEAFQVAYPSVDVRIVPEATREAVGSLVNGTTDLSIMSSDVRTRGLRAIRLFDDELVLIVSSRHRLAQRRSVAPADLRDERFLAYLDVEHNTAFKEILLPAGVSPQQVSVLQLTEGILALAKANMGVAILARWAVQPYLADGKLKAIPIDHPAVRRTWRAVVRASKSTPPYIDSFIRFLTKTTVDPSKSRPAK